ncbi:hypothetical protein CKM354_000729900 [Cercospora kikuchii]|uniref:Uncharacterized protein n=1 Tax=Cercospora kikuchii TaxID=84275 RepID=A0A9P3CP75_9PEZI|nr:uncharacterized protein CKM354_000729900 [Cercospora kikuchii]GIZ44090.1 hypothetical protein CKM354_000729900 [Cercospora kikuchii]
MWASEISDQNQSAACEEYGDSFFKELLEAAGMSDTECDDSRESAIGNIATSGESIDPGTIHSDRRDSLLTTDDLKVEPTAASVVFGTYELLEQILLQSDNGTILRLQRTNKAWDHVTNRSQALQKKLFFKAEVPHHGPFKGTIRWNPLLRLKVIYRRDKRSIERRTGQHGEKRYVYRVELQSKPRGPAYISVPRRYNKRRLEESWRRMLLVQGCKHTAKISIYGATETVISAGTKMGQVQPSF